MMKRAILCEGKTDAILISYFLEKFGWEYIKNKVIELPVDRDNEVAKWYLHPEKPNMELVIWGVGGIDRMSIKLQQIIERTQNERNIKNRFEQIVLFFDKDNRNEDECKDLLKNWLNMCNDFEISGSLQLGEWLDAKTKLRDSSRSIYKMRIIAIVLPPDNEGNFEIFLMESLKKQSSCDSKLVDEAKKFIECLPDEPYLKKSRYRIKARFGSILSVISSDWAFPARALTKIQWEKHGSVLGVYGKLRDL